MKTADLTGAALDWAVAKCELLNGANYTLAVDEDWDGTLRVNFGGMYPEWSSDWQEGGAIIEREKINISMSATAPCMAWFYDGLEMLDLTDGETPLIAAMRCYVASKLGDEVELPEELLSCAHD